MEENDTVATANRDRLIRNIDVLDKLASHADAFIARAQQEDKPLLTNCLVYLKPTLMHVSAMLDTLKPKADGKIYWNVLSLAVLARALQESFFGLAYYCAPVDDDTRALKALLWDRQAMGKVMEILDSDPGNPGNADVARRLKTRLDELQAAILHSPGMAALQRSNPSRAKRIIKRYDEYMTEDRSEIWLRAGPTAIPYEFTWKLLSQWTHLTPLSLHTLDGLYKGPEAAALEANTSIRLAIGCLALGLAMTSDHAKTLGDAAARAMETLSGLN